MKSKAIDTSVTVLTAVFIALAMSPLAVADEKWIVETQDNSAGFTHTHTEVVESDPVPAAEGGGESGGGAPDGQAGPAEPDPLATCLQAPDILQRVICIGAWIGVRGTAQPPAAEGAAAPAGGARAPVVITSTDVSKVMASGSGIVRQPPGAKALVSKIVIVYTSPAAQDLTTRVGDQSVSIVATPVSYTWDWGDGATTTTTDPGAAYPDHTVYHKYSHTAQGVTITLTTTWSATYSVGGGPPQPVSGTLTTTDTSDPFDLVRRISYLTDDAEEAQGH